MILAASLLAKYADLIISKLIGKRVDLLLDQKQRAAKAFVELYFCLEKLESTACDLVAALDDDRLETWATVNFLAKNESTIRSIWIRLFELGENLQLTLEIFDPVLADAADQIYRMKFSIFHYLEKTIWIPEDEPRNSRVSYLCPSDRILAIDMGDLYSYIEAHRGDLWSEEHAWPYDLLLDSDIEAGYTRVTFEASDQEATKRLRDLVSEHTKDLSAARQSIGEFIKERFPVDQILFVTRRVK